MWVTVLCLGQSVGPQAMGQYFLLVHELTFYNLFSLEAHFGLPQGELWSCLKVTNFVDSPWEPSYPY